MEDTEENIHAFALDPSQNLVVLLLEEDPLSSEQYNLLPANVSLGGAVIQIVDDVFGMFLRPLGLSLHPWVTIWNWRKGRLMMNCSTSELSSPGAHEVDFVSSRALLVTISGDGSGGAIDLYYFDEDGSPPDDLPSDPSIACRPPTKLLYSLQLRARAADEDGQSGGPSHSLGTPTTLRAPEQPRAPPAHDPEWYHGWWNAPSQPRATSLSRMALDAWVERVLITERRHDEMANDLLEWLERVLATPPIDPNQGGSSEPALSPEFEYELRRIYRRRLELLNEHLIYDIAEAPQGSLTPEHLLDNLSESLGSSPTPFGLAYLPPYESARAVPLEEID
ncbi:hypothetical protein C8Q76DRAFT_798311 [Earliella scabrosa]|nr:hypothetical protein C8Q76DRAFT_798311 [Earliella scabrosa]